MGYTKGEWKQQGTLIWSDCGDDSGKSAVICILGEPYPRFVEYKPLELHSKGWDLQMANAHLIAAAPRMYLAGQGLDYAIGSAIIEVAKATTLTPELLAIINTYILPAQENWREALKSAEGKE